ncbi:uncharacterized protein ACA1_151090 [Acanthamoeba castellanii str. Neff]|uniref:Transmembrane protein n=1 Tax=Acanthamoeba castellanii (strain ATCC 30010 / Neff) TaxID=1257118 RepID=L8H0Q8_ACACF|nr:uncharacterized protein ACA1_151090 [Acanthamoeba castellanii str. Neff]ELR18807.1 hypothetical protein ACA1_151090 [Acanthamoeba castellanii str. Neff]
MEPHQEDSFASPLPLRTFEGDAPQRDGSSGSSSSEVEEEEVNDVDSTTTTTSGGPSPPINKRQQRWGQEDGDIEMDKLSRTSSLDVDQDEEDAGTFILELDKESGLGDSDRTYRTRIERGWAFALSKVGPLVGALGALAALGFIFAVWGGIPLGDPKEDLFDEDGSWPLVFITNPLVMGVIGYLNVAMFLGCAGVTHPFRGFTPALLIIIVVEIVILFPIVQKVGFFELFGAVNIFICYAATFAGLLIHEFVKRCLGKRNRTPNYLRKIAQYGKVVFALFVHLLILTGYVIGYRYVSSTVQPILSFSLAISVFIMRKVLLALTDMFPIEMAMLISSLWVTNLTDMCQTLAFPSVKDPITYIYLFAINLFTNLANLLFLTPWYVASWFRIRVWVKNNLGHIFTCCFCTCKWPEVRFYFWRIWSQTCSMLFYLGISSILRYGPNSEYYMFSEDPIVKGSDERSYNVLSSTGYRNSLLYASANLFPIALAGLFGYLLVRFLYKETYAVLVKTHGMMLLHNTTYIGFVVAILAHNGLLAVMIVQYHQRVWWAFN